MVVAVGDVVATLVLSDPVVLLRVLLRVALVLLRMVLLIPAVVSQWCCWMQWCCFAWCYGSLS